MFHMQNVQNNGTLYIHVYFVKAGYSPNPADDNYERKFTVYRSRRKSSVCGVNVPVIVELLFLMNGY